MEPGYKILGKFKISNFRPNLITKGSPELLYKTKSFESGSLKKAKKDYDGDGKVETGSQEYLGSRDKAIKKAMKKRSVTTEAQSNWREDLKEIMGEVEKTEGKKSKSKNCFFKKNVRPLFLTLRRAGVLTPTYLGSTSIMV